MDENKTLEAVLGLVKDVQDIRSDIKGFEERLNKDLNERFLQIGKYILRFEERLNKDLDVRFTNVHKVLDTHTQQLQNITRVVAGPMANSINKIEEHLQLETTDFFFKDKKT
ncbi:MAG: hypothetical protein MUP16_02940 [Sedimentisphaerales bacterium]|jgi:SMC interacting uncharacterized protein involved in chromosome segregation|nr:hypothetical protein [Sedimentisphaerales bacterium]